jgi:Mg-chelatase subunit ChlD
METSSPPVTFAERFHRLFSQARFFSVSLLAHVIIIVFASSYVMFQRLDPAPDFVSTGSLVPDEGPSGLLEEPPVEAPKLKEPEPSLPASSSAGVIGTIANNNAFVVDTSGSSGIDLGKAINSAKGVGDMSGLGEALTKGMGKVGGTSMVKFMGQTAEVQAVVFVVDISGSMIMGNKSAKTYDHLEDEIKRVIRALDAKTKFGLVAFSGEAHLYKPQLTLASSDEKQRAINWLRKQSPVEGTQATDADDKAKHRGTRADLGLEAAFKLAPDTIFFVSDGEPTGAPPAEVLKLVKEWQKGRPKPVAINSVAYLADSGQKFMGDLAKQNAGSFREINPRDARRN